MTAHTPAVLNDVRKERDRQDAKWGEQHHPDGTNFAANHHGAVCWRALTDDAAKLGTVTWLHILLEEVAEAAETEDPADLRAELVQVAAVAVAWVEALDRRAVKILDAAQDIQPEDEP